MNPSAHRGIHDPAVRSEQHGDQLMTSIQYRATGIAEASRARKFQSLQALPALGGDVSQGLSTIAPQPSVAAIAAGNQQVAALGRILSDRNWRDSRRSNDESRQIGAGVHFGQLRLQWLATWKHNAHGAN